MSAERIANGIKHDLKEFPDDDFLDWCIDNSFEANEITRITKTQLQRTKSNPAYREYIKDNPSMAINTFKHVVEFNLCVRIVKWVIVIGCVKWFYETVIS